MITITKSNFSNWWSINLFGKLIDNAKSEAKAMQVAKQVKKEQAKQGSKLIIINTEEI